MNSVKVIVQKLANVDEAALKETLLPEEACVYCGRELIGKYSIKTNVCGKCSRERRGAFQRFDKIGMACDLIREDPDFNYGRGGRFFNAFDRAVIRGDFK